MSLGLQATKRRIASVNSTKKITKAMQLVATAKLKTMKKNLASTSAYADEVGFVMASLMNRIEKERWNEVFAIDNKVRKGSIYLILSSSLGLCGGYNYNLFKQAITLIDKDNDLLVIIGSKGISFFKNRGYNVNDFLGDAMINFSYSRVDQIVKYILHLYSTSSYAQIKLLYTHYKNQITFIPTINDIYPFSALDNITKNLSRKEKDMIVEPDPIIVAKQLLPLYIKSIIFSRINESLLSEYASRRNAMENATNNAEDIVSQLQIEFNKARQAAITQEITEVVGGANAS